MLSVLLSAPLISAFQPIGAVIAPMQNVRGTVRMDIAAGTATPTLTRAPALCS